jgi:hypothetical protein
MLIPDAVASSIVDRQHDEGGVGGLFSCGLLIPSINPPLKGSFRTRKVCTSTRWMIASLLTTLADKRTSIARRKAGWCLLKALVDGSFVAADVPLDIEVTNEIVLSIDGDLWDCRCEASLQHQNEQH